MEVEEIFLVNVNESGTMTVRKRLDHQIICDLVNPRTCILDLGCGDGDLMALLVREKNAVVQGIELDGEAVQRCVEKGLTVFQGDIETGLTDFPDQSFDEVILNQSMQEVKKVDVIIRESLRVARRVIVGFPNFAHLISRSTLFFRGKTPVTSSLPHYWYETPNVRFLSIRDFDDFCRNKGLKILQTVYLGKDRVVTCCPNLLARNAIYRLSK
ncbi:MAG: Bifunctional methionine biosynthesis protein MetXA/MetW [Syntrophus sp. SKADARSKE-3]|nr:Bifunctional methionine biosynthesis protein MetXA/MetW [Syntrophus sp. SKADARSKE-3]